KIAGERFAFTPPDFGDAQGGVDGKTVEGAVGDIYFESEIRRRIKAQIDAILTANQGLAGDPVRLVRFQALAPPAPPKGRGAAALDRQPKLLGKDHDEAAEEVRVAFVLVGKGHDFET